MITIPVADRVHVIGRADIIDGTSTVAVDWIEPYLPLLDRWDMGWMHGRYIHVENANDNGRVFNLDDVVDHHKLIPHTPLNVMHHQQDVVGHYVAAEMLYPTGGASLDEPPTPWVETFAGLYRRNFPEVYKKIKEAARRGLLSQSMEAVSDTITCLTCGVTYPYAGPHSPTYRCGHLDRAGSPHRLNFPKATPQNGLQPGFVGGGIVLPPGRPGWSGAIIKQVDELLQQHDPDMTRIHEEVAATYPDGDADHWHEVMACLLAMVGYDWGRPKKKKREPGAMDSELEGIGSMIAVYPPTEILERLHVDGGETVDEMHLTLIFVAADASTLVKTPVELIEAIRGVTATTSPIEATISGMGRFNIGDGEEATYVSVDAPGLDELYVRLLSALTTAGVDVAHSHGHTAHITVQYHPAGQGPDFMPEPDTFLIDQVCFVVGEDRYDIPFGS